MQSCYLDLDASTSTTLRIQGTSICWISTRQSVSLKWFGWLVETLVITLSATLRPSFCRIVVPKTRNSVIKSTVSDGLQLSSDLAHTHSWFHHSRHHNIFSTIEETPSCPMDVLSQVCWPQYSAMSIHLLISTANILLCYEISTLIKTGSWMTEIKRP